MLKNKTKGEVLVNKVTFCKSIFSKAFGLMFRKKLKDKAWVFVFDEMQAGPLHNFFVFQKIDVLFLDEKKRVVELWQGFKPFTCHKPRRKAKYVIELPAGAADNVKLGDSISFK